MRLGRAPRSATRDGPLDGLGNARPFSRRRRSRPGVLNPTRKAGNVGQHGVVETCDQGFGRFVHCDRVRLQFSLHTLKIGV